jgi:hypothetical protein
MDVLMTALAAAILAVAAFVNVVYRNQTRTLRMRPVATSGDAEMVLGGSSVCLQFIDPPPTVLCFPMSVDLAAYVGARNGQPLEAEFEIIYRAGHGAIVRAETYELKAIDGRPAGFMPPLRWPDVPPAQFNWW